MNVIPEKPNLSLYLRQKVVEIPKGVLPWQWAIKLESGVLIVNKDELEHIAPDQVVPLVGWTFESVSFSTGDTTMHFRSPETDTIFKWSIAPTKYAVHDPVHGGEVYPQWPEELEERGIPSVEGGEISTPPPEEWSEHYNKLTSEGDKRRKDEATEFLKEED
jgi:hypothetical protein